MSEFDNWLWEKYGLRCTKASVVAEDYKECWEAARKGYVKLKDVERILKENYHPDSGQYYDREYIHADVIEEIKKLDNKKVTLEDVLLAEQSKDRGGK